MTPKTLRRVLVTLPLVVLGSLTIGATADRYDLPVPHTGMCGRAHADSDDDGSKPIWPMYAVACGKDASFGLAPPASKFRARIVIRDNCKSSDAPTTSVLQMRVVGGPWSQACRVADGTTKVCEFDIPPKAEAVFSFVCNGAAESDGGEDDKPGCGYALVDVPAASADSSDE